MYLGSLAVTQHVGSPTPSGQLSWSRLDACLIFETLKECRVFSHLSACKTTQRYLSPIRGQALCKTRYCVVYVQSHYSCMLSYSILV